MFEMRRLPQHFTMISSRGYLKVTGSWWAFGTTRSAVGMAATARLCTPFRWWLPYQLVPTKAGKPLAPTMQLPSMYEVRTRTTM